MLATVLIVVTPFTFDKTLEEIADGRPFIERWIAAHENVTSIHATFERRIYDRVFNTAKIADGEVFYAGRRDGFIELSPADVSYLPTEFQHNSVRYSPKPDKPERWEFVTNTTWYMDPDEKTVDCIELPNDPSPNRGWFHLFDIDMFFPFLPRSVVKVQLEQWKFEFVTQMNSLTYIRATPLTERLQNQMHSVVLAFDKTTRQLRAISRTDPTQNLEVVYVFNDVIQNPSERPGFDLTGYKVSTK